MKQNSKIFIGVAVVAAVMAGAYFTNVGGLQGCIGRGCAQRSSALKTVPTDFAITGEDMNPSSSGKAYHYMTVHFKNTAPVPTTADLSFTIDGKEVATMYAMDKVNDTTAYISNDILLSSFCKGHRIFAPQLMFTIDKDNKIAESDETNNSMAIDASTDCITTDATTRGEFMQGLAIRMTQLDGEDLSKYNKVVFSDVPTNSVYLNGVDYLYEKGVIKGYVDGTVGVDKNLTRAEAIKMMVSVAGLSLGDLNPPHPYSDVADTSTWYYQYVKGAVTKDPAYFGITDVKPYAGLKFRPNEFITNIDAKVMMNAIGK